MATVAEYVTAQELVNYLGWTKKGEQWIINDDSVPSEKTIEDYISVGEEEMEKEVRRNWRDGYKTVTEELHSWTYKSQAMIRRGIYGSVMTFDLYYENIVEITKLEVWNGSTFEDLVADGTEGVSIFNEDYFIDKKAGRLYINTKFPTQGMDNIKISYTWGEWVAKATDDIPRPLRRACMYLAGAEMLVTHGSLFQYAIEDSAGAGNYMHMAESWRERAYELMDLNRSQKAYNLFG